MNKKIKIGYTTYKVIYLPKKTTDRYGECMYNKKIIGLNPNMHHTTASDTLLHEVLHAIWHEASIEQAPVVEQEFIVNTVSTWLTMVMRDNPWFAQFILNSKSLWKTTNTNYLDEEVDCEKLINKHNK
jgi:hypothetical protein